MQSYDRKAIGMIGYTNVVLKILEYWLMLCCCNVYTYSKVSLHF
jgi:hypothetical protein